MLGGAAELSLLQQVGGTLFDGQGVGDCELLGGGKHLLLGGFLVVGVGDVGEGRPLLVLKGLFGRLVQFVHPQGLAVQPVAGLRLLDGLLVGLAGVVLIHGRPKLELMLELTLERLVGLFAYLEILRHVELFLVLLGVFLGLAGVQPEVGKYLTLGTLQPVVLVLVLGGSAQHHHRPKHLVIEPKCLLVFVQLKRIAIPKLPHLALLHGAALLDAPLVLLHKLGRLSHLPLLLHLVLALVVLVWQLNL